MDSLGIFEAIMSADFVIVRAAWIARARAESARKVTAKSWLKSNGYESVTVDDDVRFLPDGRKVVRVHGTAYALRPEIHANRLAAAFEAAKSARPETETKSVVGTESLSAMTCPKCGDSLQHSTVCTSCAAGKLGYRHRYTCVCGGVDLISKEML